MRIVIPAITAIAALLVSCGSESKAPAPAPAAQKAEAPKPSDESQRFPKANLVATKVVDKELEGKTFMPGGTVAHYKKGKTEYEMFVARFPAPQDAAIVLPDWKKALADSKLIPSFGGYFGQD